ncbi:MAG TPA: alpha/beta fold hydrolase [Solirubrobacterales bacterium]|nr:alpha/beta fold hydrolase [Solirubrobacterales bacterium]
MGEGGEAAWYRRRWRWLAAATIALLVALGIGVAISWHFSDAVLVPDHSPWPESTEVLGVSPKRISLARSEDSERPGVYGLDWPGGHAVIGAIEHESGDAVVRKLLSSHGYLVAGRKVLVEADVYAGNPREALGIPFSTVPVADELGLMPDWLIRGRSRTWTIVVHGINGTPQEGLHLLPALRRAGLPTMLIAYREDLGAPPSPDGFHHMGLTEWRDLQAAAGYALAHGARRLVLVGYSMGGAIVAQFMQKSSLAGRVAGLVLDAPVLDWKRTIEFNSEEMGLPGFAALPVIWAIGARVDADWDSLDALAHPEAFHLPILLFHGTDDKVVPISGSDDFAAELPRWVTYYRVPEAGHTQAWNVDPRLYERRLSAFLASLEPSQRALRTPGNH